MDKTDKLMLLISKIDLMNAAQLDEMMKVAVAMVEQKKRQEAGIKES